MTTPIVGILDHGAGNLRNVARAFAAAGFDPRISHEASVLSACDAIVLPGVGAFGPARRRLRDLALDEWFLATVQSGLPTLGICVGFQLLTTGSDETRGSLGEEDQRGLGLLPVRAVRLSDTDGEPVPRIGWSPVTWHGSPATDLTDDAYYFVHSFAVEPLPAGDWAEARHGGMSFTAAVAQDNLWACQFHPEKSGAAGLRFLAAFREALL